MTKKAKPTDTPFLILERKPGEHAERALARTLLRPAVGSAQSLHRLLGRQGTTPDLMALIQELSDQCDNVSSGNFGRPEAMMTAQAHTLEALFHYLTAIACNNLGSNFDFAERIFRLAFRAQNQGRATIETLAMLKNPPMVFAKQANVTTGPQQVNNGVARTREMALGQNELLEQTNGERLESGPASKAGYGDREMEAVGEFDRAANG